MDLFVSTKQPQLDIYVSFIGFQPFKLSRKPTGNNCFRKQARAGRFWHRGLNHFVWSEKTAWCSSLTKQAKNRVTWINQVPDLGFSEPSSRYRKVFTWLVSGNYKQKPDQIFFRDQHNGILNGLLVLNATDFNFIKHLTVERPEMFYQRDDQFSHYKLQLIPDWLIVYLHCVMLAITDQTALPAHFGSLNTFKPIETNSCEYTLGILQA